MKIAAFLSNDITAKLLHPAYPAAPQRETGLQVGNDGIQFPHIHQIAGGMHAAAITDGPQPLWIIKAQFRTRPNWAFDTMGFTVCFSLPDAVNREVLDVLI